MAGVARAIYSVAIGLCIPATCVLVAPLVSLSLKCRPLRTAHMRSLLAHVATLLLAEGAHVLYLMDVVDCRSAVPIQNYIDISASCWLHMICFNMLLSFKNGGYTRSCTSFMYLIYSLCVPLAIMIAFERYICGSWNILPGSLYDAKVCFSDQGALRIKGQSEASLHFSILRGLCLMVTATLFLCLSYKIGFRRRNAVLCQDDADCISDIAERQKQAMNYILVAVATGVVEISADLGSWYFRNRQTELMDIRRAMRNTSDAPEHDNALQLGELLIKSLSFSIDFLRVLFICEVLCYGGPKTRLQDRRVQTEDALPPYEEASRLSSPRTLMMFAPPPSYSSIFSHQNTEDDDVLLLESAQPQSEDLPVSIQSVQTHEQVNEQTT